MLTKKYKGFTLIELLVVIAIIGILSSIVLVSVNSARLKAKDAAVKSNIEGSRVAAEMYYDDPAKGNYLGVCNGATFNAIKASLALQTSAISCFNTANGYCLKANVPSGGVWCADSKGYSGNLASTCLSDADVNVICNP